MTRRTFTSRASHRTAGTCITLAALLAATACDSDPAAGTGDTADTVLDTTAPDASDTADTVVATYCEGTTTFAWSATPTDHLAAFPDDVLTVADAATLTGRRVHFGTAAWLDAEPELFQSLWRDLEKLDGFGISAGVSLRFSGPIKAAPSGSIDSVTNDALILVDLGTEPPTRIPYETELIEGGTNLLVWPMRPLREGTRHAVIATTALLAEGDGCIAPSQALQDALDGPAPSAVEAGFAALRNGLSLLKTPHTSVSAATVFTTQTFSAATLKQRTHLRAQTYAFAARPSCTTKNDITACDAAFTAYDYRIEGALDPALDDTFTPKTYRLPVHVWMPKTRTGPVPVLVFGHGLGGSADDAKEIGTLAAPLGLATVAISAPRHGDHPTSKAGADYQSVFTDFFGVNLQTFSIEGFVFRENVRQAAFDKLQVLELLRAHPDLDGDDTPDLDLDKVAYWGISLGGILGPNFVAQSNVGAAIFSVPGARLISVISDAADFSALFDLLASVVGDRDLVLRQAPIAQTLIDGGDPIGWANHLVTDTVSGRPPAHILIQMVMGDTTVPNIATRSLARAIGTPQVPTIITPIDLLPAAASAPVTANLSTAASGDTALPSVVTAGLYQFDRASRSPGANPVKATHGGVFSGIESIGQVTGFLTTWLSSPTGTPTITDPYSDYGTPPLR
ncbi:MAG: hypothetical protein JNJ59_19130 [Deltaproteobacteria bacterium]|nr:hypothetical protein [Deltaproteobacteria bacterium]